MRTLILTSLVVAACGSADEMQSGPSPFIPGFNPTAPKAGQLRVVTPPTPLIPPGKDITYCSYLDFDVQKTMDVTSYLGFQSKGGHHTILYAATHKQAPNTHECTDDDMYNVRYIGGGGTDATISASQIPKGIVFRVPAGSQLMMVSHYINASLDSVVGQAAYNLDVQDPSPDVDPGDLLTVVKTDFTLPPGIGRAHTECLLKQDFKFFMLGGHAHEYATNIKLGVVPISGNPTTFYDVAWDKSLIFNTPLNPYTKESPYEMHAGDRFTVDCTYNNTTDQPISFPTEMCVGFGYFFPAQHEIDCVDEAWPG